MSNSCEFCDKKGLPVLPVRYAIAPLSAKAPQLGAPFSVRDIGGDLLPIGGNVHYTTRLLRGGYLYVHDEARNRWEAYYVTDDAYYMRFEIDKPMPAAYAGRVPCIQTGHQEVASLITISDPRNATKVWFGFSDVEWTPEVLKRHASADYRKRHMRMLDVKKALSGAAQPHAQRITQLGSVVTEYTLDPPIASQAFRDFPFGYRPRKLQLAEVLRQAQALRPDRGVVLALNDPVGVTSELAILMQSRIVAFNARPHIQRALSVAGTIAGLEEAIKSSARSAAALGVEDFADMVEAGPAAYNPNAMLAGVPGDPEQAEKLRAMITPQALKKAADDEWKKYTHYMNRSTKAPRFSDDERRAWKRRYDADLEKFDAEQIAPLAQSHAAWMRSDCMANYFECNFDEKDTKSGVAYCGTLRMCIDQTADKSACFEVYEEWLTGDISDRRALALRALTLNQDDLAKKIRESLSAGMDWRALPNDNVFNAFKTLLERLPTSAAGLLGALLDQLGGVLIKVTRGVLAGQTQGLPALAAMGGASGRQIARLQISGSKKAFVEYYVRELAKLGGPRVTSHQLRRATAAQVRLLGYEGLKLEGSDRRTWLVALDRNVLRDIPSRPSGQAWANAAAKAIHSPETLQRLDAQSWRNFIASDVRGGIAVGILQVANVTKLVSDYTNAMSHEAVEAKRRLWTGLTAMAGTIGELSGIAVERLALRSLNNARGIRLFGFAIRIGGRVIGASAGFIVGALDFHKGLEEYRKKNKGLAFLSFGSAFLGGVLTIAFLAVKFVPILVIVALVAVFVLLTYLVEKNKDNKLQEWLARCYFNTDLTQRYPDLEVEQNQLELALKG